MVHTSAINKGRLRRSGLFALLAIASASFVRAEPQLLSAEQLRAMASQETPAAIALFREFLALPNDALHVEDIERQNAWLLQAFNARGFETRLLATEGSPALFAERRRPGAERTVLVYLQADGQPVDPAAWNQPDPYEAVLMQASAAGRWEALPWSALDSGLDPEWRIFARSASDSKGPMTQFLAAMDLFAAAGRQLPYNLKVIVDTEEELGSPNLAAAINANRELLAADLLLIFDGPPHASNRPTVTLGARGIATITLTTFGPKVAQHSGHYGNFVPNPALALAQILASMKSPDGVVQIEGFYDGVAIGDETRAILEAVPDDEERILRSMGLIRADAVAASLQESLQYPSLNVRGLSAAWVGDGARTIIPPSAVAEIDIRLVMESDPDYLVGLVRDHVAALGYKVLDRAPTDAERMEFPRLASMTHDISYGAFRSDPESPPARMARAGMRHLYGEEPVIVRTMGGSIPISPIIEALGVPAAVVPSVNIDNNQHSPNENIRVGNFLEGIVILMSVLQQTPD